jgi:hypothetical protein
MPLGSVLDIMDKLGSRFISLAIVIGLTGLVEEFKKSLFNIFSFSRKEEILRF